MGTKYDVIAYLAEKDGEGKETGKEVPMKYASACDGLAAIGSVAAALREDSGGERYAGRVIRVEIVPRTEG